MKPLHQQGFSLVELLVTIAILAILAVLAIPSYQQWTINTRIRTATESIQNGLRYARNEASQQATNVRFQLNTGTGGAWSGWTVCKLPASAASAASVANCTGETVLQSYVTSGSTDGVEINASTAVADVAPKSYLTPLSGGGLSEGITFTSLGRPSDYGGGDSNSSIVRIDANDTQANSRRLDTTISAGGMVNMCDPQVTYSATSPQGCQ